MAGRRVATVPARGKVTLDGKPLANVVVTFTEQMPAGQRAATADAVTTEDGAFVLTTNSKFDGATDRVIQGDRGGQPPAARRTGDREKDLPKLPTEYARAATTPLVVKVREGREERVRDRPVDKGISYAARQFGGGCWEREQDRVRDRAPAEPYDTDEYKPDRRHRAEPPMAKRFEDRPVEEW